MTYRPDINILRAIAVVGVIFYHFKVPGFEGGFAGVDVFFVISGFLMTGIITSAVNRGNFSVLHFYSKRIKRIIPALLFLIVVVILVTFFIFLPEDFKTNSTNGFFSLVFLSNIWYWHSFSYFSPVSRNNLFLHLWSLAVEWQFYVVYPLFLIILNKFLSDYKKQLKTFIAVSIVIMLSSFWFSVYHQSLSFYLLPSRSWEMGFGGICFFISNKLTVQKFRKAVSILGYFAILLSFIFLNSKMSWPGPFTLIPVMATCLVIAANFNEFKILKFAPFQSIGKISYSLYLWHWPIAVLGLYFGYKFHFSTSLFFIGFSLLMAFISFNVIERKSYDVKIISAFAILITAGLGVFSLRYFNTFIFKDEALKISRYGKLHNDELAKQFGKLKPKCYVKGTGYILEGFDTTNCLTQTRDKKNVLLIGDSHAADISLSLKKELGKFGINVNQATSSGCIAVMNTAGAAGCKSLMNYVYNEYIPTDYKKIDGIIISCNWVNGNDGSRYKLLDDLKTTLNFLRRYKINTIVIGQTETYTIPYATILAREYQYNISIALRYLAPESSEMNNFLITNLGDEYINIYNANFVQRATPDVIPYIYDESHFTSYGGDLAVKRIFASKTGKLFLNKLQNKP